MKVLLSVPFFAAVLALSAAHLCMFNPQQRSSLSDSNNPGSNDCIFLKGPCGGQLPGTATTTWRSGQNVTIILQKNLDHWNQASPGYFAVNLMQGTMVKEIARTPDTSAKSLTVYLLNGMVPTGATGRMIVQAVYMTNNPQAPAAFYQCADVDIH